MKETNKSIGTERLHKFIARCGVCSRRDAELLISSGNVQVNGEIVTELGTKVGPEDKVYVSGGLIKEPKLHYVVMNKPRGVVTTLDDPQKRPTVAKYLPNLGVSLKPIGRLDMDTEGLLLFTNDGEFANRIAHPRFSIEKEYLTEVKGQVLEKQADRFRKGMRIDGIRTRPAKVTIIRYNSKHDTTQLRIALHEGRNRQVRKMCDIIGHPVISLKRTRVAFLTLKGMPSGMCRTLGKLEVNKLKRIIDMITE